jgi:hypothetical protein
MGRARDQLKALWSIALTLAVENIWGRSNLGAAGEGGAQREPAQRL